MKPILTAAQTRAWDAYTMEHAPIASLDLMERASEAFVAAFRRLVPAHRPVQVWAGMGNNGGDGLAIARLLHEQGWEGPIEVYAVPFSPQASPDFLANAARLPMPLRWLSADGPWPALGPGTVAVDAIFGSGLSRPPQGLAAAAIEWLNASGAWVVSVDIASGLFADAPTPAGSAIVRPRHSICFQAPKLAFLLPDCAPFVGEWQAVDIGLLPGALAGLPSPYSLTERADAAALRQERGKFSHKGTFGHLLQVAGSVGKMGASVLAARGALRGGAGLLTAWVPQEGMAVMQTAVPEAQCWRAAEAGGFWAGGAWPFVPAAVCVGPGLGQAPETAEALGKLLEACGREGVPLVADADALNLMARHPALLEALPAHAVLTPHPKEFERLAGPSAQHFERLERARELSRRLGAVLVLKGAHSAVCLPDGRVRFNSTGNPGMATAGSGDVLAGLIGALLAQGHAPEPAAVLGVYLHGLAGDLASERLGPEALTASDLPKCLGKAWKALSEKNNDFF